MNTYIVIGFAIGIVVAVFLLRFAFRRDKSPDYSNYQNLYLMNNEELKNKVKEYLFKGKKIEAIKYVHEKSKAGLLESKNFVESLDPLVSLKGNVTHNAAPFLQTETSDNKLIPDNALIPEIRQLLEGGNKIQAIKLAAENYEMGLKAAKAYVDNIEEKMKNGQI